ncbi:glycosyltransferase, partial [Streptomyces sp. NPDC006335]|uniref:glycosyltransferase family 2 protein n=1 Tax=Streptomyces sp. NPDC006335 TaxID=3156895 RepID=UPI0033AEE470
MLKVSIVVPVYNAGRYIDMCAPSLLGQTLGEDAYEIIYVDDGSTDDSAQRLDELAAEHAQVRVIHQENSGWPGKPRNVGVREARG